MRGRPAGPSIAAFAEEVTEDWVVENGVARPLVDA